MQFLELSTRERALVDTRLDGERKPPSPSALFVFDTVFIERGWFTRQLRLHANGKPPTFLATM